MRPRRPLHYATAGSPQSITRTEDDKGGMLLPRSKLRRRRDRSPEEDDCWGCLAVLLLHRVHRRRRVREPQLLLSTELSSAVVQAVASPENRANPTAVTKVVIHDPVAAQRKKGRRSIATSASTNREGCNRRVADAWTLGGVGGGCENARLRVCASHRLPRLLSASGFLAVS
nr:hypothetical protein Iba_scaffold2963CG0030 [Ipomoea batatas]